MATATDTQVQTYVDQRIRPRAEQTRALVIALRDDLASIDDVYKACLPTTTPPYTPTWTDKNTSGPPCFLTPQDVLNFDGFIKLMLKCIDGTATTQDVAELHANFLVFQEACVRPIGG